jgi:hypothetical protein
MPGITWTTKLYYANKIKWPSKQLAQPNPAKTNKRNHDQWNIHNDRRMQPVNYVKAQASIVQSVQQKRVPQPVHIKTAENCK